MLREKKFFKMLKFCTRSKNYLFYANDLMENKPGPGFNMHQKSKMCMVKFGQKNLSDKVWALKINQNCL